MDTEFSIHLPTTAITAGFDVLCNEGIEFDEKLKDAVILAELVNFDNKTYVFLRFADIDNSSKKILFDQSFLHDPYNSICLNIFECKDDMSGTAMRNCQIIIR